MQYFVVKSAFWGIGESVRGDRRQARGTIVASSHLFWPLHETQSCFVL